jgi:hypothetical protein
MCTQTVNPYPTYLNLAMQQAATLETVRGNILVRGLHDRVAAENGIAVMAMVVDRVHTVSMVCPELVGQELVLRHRGVIGMALGMTQVFALHFLQKYDIRIQLAQTLAQLMDHKALVELREAFVDVVGGDLESGHVGILPNRRGGMMLQWALSQLDTLGCQMQGVHRLINFSRKS